MSNPKTPLEFARDFLKRSLSYIEDSPHYFKERKNLCGGIKLKGIDSVTNKPVEWFSINEDKLPVLIEEAKRDPIAFEAACELAAKFSKESLPPRLWSFIVNILTGRLSKPTPKRGPSIYTNKARFQKYAQLAYFLVKYYNCHPYRNEERNKKPEKDLGSCAFDIIAEAANALDKERTITYNMVRGAWEKYGAPYQMLLKRQSSLK